jgi:hypothetical protein
MQDIRTAVGRLSLRRGASDDGKDQGGGTNLFMREFSFPPGRRIVNLVQHLDDWLVAAER